VSHSVINGTTAVAEAFSLKPPGTDNPYYMLQAGLAQELPGKGECTGDGLIVLTY
jgi:hypothetical protein